MVTTHSEFKERVIELLDEKKLKRVDFINRLSTKMGIEYKSAEHYIYDNKRKGLPSVEAIKNIACAIDRATYRDNFEYILNLAELEETATKGSCEQMAEQTMNAFVPDDVTINGVRFVRADRVDKSSALYKIVSYVDNISTKPNNAVMQFTCKKETKLVNPYPVQSKDSQYVYEYTNYYGNEIAQDSYIVVGGNIYHEDTSHAFGYKFENNQNTISLYSLIENALNKDVPSGMVAEYIDNLQRIHKRQKMMYGAIGKGGISTNAFCWLNFIVGFYSKLYEEKFM